MSLMDSPRTTLMFSAIVWATLLGSEGQQVRPSCEVTNSAQWVGFRDVNCECHAEIPLIENLHTLTMNFTACQTATERNTSISWETLGMMFHPVVVVYEGATIVFSDAASVSTITPAVPSSIAIIEFIRCHFNSIPPRAFRGLQTLLELRFVNNFIGKVDEHAISNLKSLDTLEFSFCDIGDILPEAISDLPNLFRFDIYQCNIKKLSSNGINNMSPEGKPFVQNCTTREMSKPYYIRCGSDEFPEFGARLDLCKNNISSIEQSAISSNLFSYLTLENNNIEHLGEQALKVELTNQCGETFLVLNSNQISSVSKGALAYATPRLGPSSKHWAYMTLTNNTFEKVGAGGFFLHPSMRLLGTPENKFFCNCSNFQEWTDPKDKSPRQQRIEESLLSNGKCSRQTLDVPLFLYYCNRVKCLNSAAQQPTPHLLWLLLVAFFSLRF